jgi:hypothetical protein
LSFIGVASALAVWIVCKEIDLSDEGACFTLFLEIREGIGRIVMVLQQCGRLDVE